MITTLSPMDQDGFRYDVFISYSPTDRDWVEDWLRPRLESAGLQVCTDDDFEPGVPKLINIERATGNSRQTLLVLSPTWVESEWSEFAALLSQTADPVARQRRLLPLMLQPCRVPPRISMLTSIDFTRTDKRDREIQRVAKVVRGELRLPERPLSREQRNRSRMLQKVRDFWIKGVLENSLYGAALIELGMEYKPDAIQHPWDMVIQQPDRPARSIPPGTKIIEVFDELGGELLILGAPGSGKTTMLLELARDLIARAEQDETYPIPIVFNLSSWGEKRAPLVEWLVDELNTKYDVPRKIGRVWVEADYVLPLLNGLDEVAENKRRMCVEAINSFRRDHGLVHLVICSRVNDYDALTARLKLQNAIIIQLIMPQQIDTYFARIGSELVDTQAAVNMDAGLRELVQTPLFLSIVILAYRGVAGETLPTVSSMERRREYLLAMYVQRMFERRQIQTHYTPTQARHWLVWLSLIMTQHAQTIFDIERLQPQWLPTHKDRHHYYRVVRIADGLAFGLVGGLVLGLLLVLKYGLITALIVGLIVTPIFGLIMSGVLRLPGIINRIMIISQIAIGVVLVTASQFLEQSGIKDAITHLLAAPGMGLSLLTQTLPQTRYFIDFILKVRDQMLWLLIPIFIWVGMRPVQLPSNSESWLTKNIRKIEPVEALAWSWSKAKVGLAKRFTTGLMQGVMWGLLFGLIANLTVGLVTGLVIGLVISLVHGIAESEADTKRRVSSGIWRSVQNGVRIALGTGIAGGAIGGFVGALVGELGLGVISGIGSGLISGFAVWLVYGGIACIQHGILRWILWRKGYAPWNYARFLDYCVDRIFLRKVGGGYIFIHRMLMEYFAELDMRTKEGS